MIAIEKYFDNYKEPVDYLSDAISKKRSKTTKNKVKPNNPSGHCVLKRLLDERHSHIVDATIYGAIEVKKPLLAIFNRKCAYCEQKSSKPEVEHFRPKKKYYWLSYEWTNFLISCRACNSHKSTDFPLKKDPIQSHPTLPNGTFDQLACHIELELLKGEEPYLLHPAIDVPKQHLFFKKSGKIDYLTEKGEESIRIYDLNRDELIKHREKLIFKIQKDILREYDFNPLPTTKRIKLEITKILQKLVDEIEDKDEFTAFRSAILQNFNEFVIDNEDILKTSLPNQAIMKEAVKEFADKYGLQLNL